MNTKVMKKKKDIANRKSKGEQIVHIIASVILLTVGASYTFALLWGAMAGLKTHDDFVMNPWKLPETWNFRNYVDAFTMLKVQETNMLGMIFNSLWLVAGGTFLSTMAATLMAYAMTKYKFVGCKLLYAIQMFTLIVPIIGTLGSQYRLFSSLGFINSPTIVLAYTGGFGAMNLYISACFRGISDTYAEAARMDGAGHYTIMFKIMLPLAKGIIIAMAVMQAISIWNDSQTALLFLPDMPTLATGIFLFSRDMTYLVRMDILMAATVLSAIPPLLLYFFTHKTILENMYMGGIKG